MSRVSVSPYSSFYSLQSKIPTEAKTNSYSNSLASVKPRTSFLLDKELRNKLGLRTGTLKKDFYRPIVRSSTGDSSSGDSDSKNILDAFFLGKALAEALNERIESAMGELLSTVGRLQSEQQKQIQEFQQRVCRLMYWIEPRKPSRKQRRMPRIRRNVLPHLVKQNHPQPLIPPQVHHQGPIQLHLQRHQALMKLLRLPRRLVKN
ncbi:hypothetical protein K2173_025648 [Erythroxylum novogranatense]|uniref:Uncharacterized protein n=1 Tax=Erythroxylum novogranatense TaxID=1862640 RepID=A0AAV8SBM5_9ROSI|nr:hypothetical protein K2173_025648 [Erythroxylum novogranatense]